MLPSGLFQLSLITFISAPLFIQITAFPVETSVDDKNRNLESRALHPYAKPLIGGALLGGGGLLAYKHFTKSSESTVAPAQSLNSLHGGSTGSPFASDGTSNLGTGTEADAVPLKTRGLQGRADFKSVETINDLQIMPLSKGNVGLASSLKRNVSNFGSIVAGSAVMNVFSGLFKGRRATPLTEDPSEEQTELNGEIEFREIDFTESDIDEEEMF